ncbi:hypothetical protein B0H14DRAFT_3045064 [Mycena olivaceomarginata]|nr:hypothetical protein B0H14DRAFT_3045064 [Mycena olivaceomarginata]
MEWATGRTPVRDATPVDTRTRYAAPCNRQPRRRRTPQRGGSGQITIRSVNGLPIFIVLTYCVSFSFTQPVAHHGLVFLSLFFFYDIILYCVA